MPTITSRFAVLPFRIVAWVATLLLLGSCSRTQSDTAGNMQFATEHAEIAPSDTVATQRLAEESAHSAAGGASGGLVEQWVEELLQSMSVRDKWAQLMVVWAYGEFQSDESARFERIRHLVVDERVGGVMFSRGDIYAQAMLTNRLQSMARIPLWVTQDMEYGAAMRLAGTTRFVPAMGVAASGKVSNSFEKGRITALEARAVGVHQVFAPVLDINNNADNPVINVRSPSAHPDTVSAYGIAFINGIQSVGLMATAKHFPGHGDTPVDSHHALPVVTHDWDRLREVELVPFRDAIAAGVQSIMTAHIAFPALSGHNNLPATLDAAVVTSLLRDSLRFEGIIVTDALEMRGISAHFSPGEAVIRAFEAGADLLLAPSDLTAALNAAEQAVRSGRVSPSTLDQRVRRILHLKASRGLLQQRPVVDLEALSRTISQRESRLTAERVARESVTLLRNDQQLIPLTHRFGKVAVLALVNAESGAPQAFVRTLRGYHQDVQIHTIDARSTRNDIDRMIRAISRTDVVVIATVTTVGGRLANDHPARRYNTINRVRALRKPVVSVILGNPYLVASNDFAQAVVLGWSATEEQSTAVAHALMGASDITGRVPVHLSDRYPAYSGISIEKRILRSDSPEVAGMSSDTLSAIDQLMQQAIREQVFPGSSVAVVRNGVLVYQKAFGFHDYEQRVRVRTTDVYDLASISKVLGTTLGMMKLVDQGRLSLDDYVYQYMPEFADGGKNLIRIRHLLTHTSGLPAFRTYVDEHQTRPAIIRAILNEPLLHTPGETYVYSDLGMITAALIAEKITGKRQDVWMQETFYTPLGMNSTTYVPSRRGADFVQRIPPTEIDTVYRMGTVQGAVHDERAFYMDGVAGHAGLFSTSGDLAIFAQFLLNGGTYGDELLLTAQVIHDFTQRQPPQNRRALGFDIKALEGFTTAGRLASAATFGHLGFTGTSLWIDPERQVAVILLTNRTWPYRTQTGEIARVRASLSDIVLSSIINE